MMVCMGSSAEMDIMVSLVRSFPYEIYDEM